MSVAEELLLIFNLKHLKEMEKISAKVKMVQYHSTQDFSNVRVTLDKEFKAIVAKRDDEGNRIDGEWTEDTVNYLDFAPSQLTAILVDRNEEIAFLRSVCEKPFGQAEFAAVLFGSTIEFTRELVAAGQPIPRSTTGRVAERDCYSTDVKKVELSDKAKAIVDRMTMAKLGL